MCVSWCVCLEVLSHLHTVATFIFIIEGNGICECFGTCCAHFICKCVVAVHFI